MKRRVWVSLGCFLTIAAFLLLPTPADSPSLLAQEGIRPVRLAASPAQLPNAARARVVSSYGKLPLSFEPNQGQTSEQVKFLSRGRGYSLSLTSDEAVLALRIGAGEAQRKGETASAGSQPVKTAVLRMKLAGANRSPQVRGLDELPGKSNYFIGKDPKKWHTNVPNYTKVHYQDVYPGIDLVYYGNQRQLEYDFVVAPGTDPKAITLEIVGTKVSSKTSLAENGDLVIKAEGGEVRFHKPVVYQIENRKSEESNRQSVDGHFVLLAKNQIGFQVGPYDLARPLYIDPVISYGTYLGGPGWDVANGIAVDSNGNAYVTGRAFDDQFPVTAGAYDTTCGTELFCDGGHSDAFVTKLNADGSSLVYSTYLGGTGQDWGTDIAVGDAGNAVVSGATDSTDFPTQNPIQDHPGGGTCGPSNNPSPCTDAFVTKLGPNGAALVYSTYLGGGGQDAANRLALDASGNAYLTGMTQSSDFPTLNAFQSVFGGGTCGVEPNTNPCPDAFVAKIGSDGSPMYSTYLGGSLDDGGWYWGIAVDGEGSAYVTSTTGSADFPVTEGALQTSLAGPGDAFVTKLDPSGASLAYSTYLGGGNVDLGYAIAVDASGSAYVTGVTISTDFPATQGAFDSTCGTDGLCDGAHDSFVSKLNADGSALIYSTYLGGSGGEVPNDIAVDSLGIAYVTGSTDSPDFPDAPGRPFGGQRLGATCGAGDNTYPCPDAFMSKLSMGGDALIVSGYLAGSGEDNANGIALDSSRDVYIAGMTGSPDFPTTSGAFQEQNAGPPDAVVVKLSDLATHVEKISPESLDFGEQLVGMTSDVMSATVKNVGDAATPVPPLDVTGDFQFTHTCGTSIAPGTSCAIDVTFTPQETGTRTGALRSYDEGSDEWYEFLPLTGVGIAPALSVSPTSLTFEDQLVGSTSETQTVTLTNTRTGPVNFANIHAATDFPQSTDCGNSLTAGASCTINVTFTPEVTGSMTEQITITYDAPGSPQSITVSGKGTDFSVEPASGSGTPSATVTAGGTANYDLSLMPTGFSGSVAMTCTWNGTQPRGTSCSVSPATVNVNGNDPASATVSISTTARSMDPVAWEPQPPAPNSYPVFYLAMWLLALAALASLALRGRRAAVVLSSLLFVVVLWTACGDNTPPPSTPTGTQAGTYMLSVTGTANGVSKSTDITLIVQ
jgi:Abnormal spindle-like microcephaly-assoc'd, ASPM-SPD-2-Hydin/Beta-propeller repeat/HYDIN/CFA65/VesB-like, Ig-like domain